ncbi:MAG: guanylate kinase [bacterium]
MGKRGLLVVISSPSGGGKTTIIRKVLASGNGNFRYSISVTTRKRRLNEKNGHDYYFLSLDDFITKQKGGEFVEWAEVHGNYYATPKAQLEHWLTEGRIVFLDLDVDGGLEIKKKYRDSSTLIFIKPPSFQRLVQRLKERKTESQAQIDKRLERFPKEIMKSNSYDYCIVNENLNKTVHEIIEIINRQIKNL